MGDYVGSRVRVKGIYLSILPGNIRNNIHLNKMSLNDTMGTVKASKCEYGSIYFLVEFDNKNIKDFSTFQSLGQEGDAWWICASCFYLVSIYIKSINKNIHTKNGRLYDYDTRKEITSFGFLKKIFIEYPGIVYEFA